MSEDTETRFNVVPQFADWYYCAVIDVHGETDYIDGYAAGPKPTRTVLQEYSKCHHSWVAGMMHVHEEDLTTIAEQRGVECEKCGRTYFERDHKPLKIIEWTVEPTPHGAYAKDK